MRLSNPAVFLTLALTVLACGALHAAVPLVQAGPGPEPAIDGELNDPVWQTAAQLFPFITLNGPGLAEVQTQAFLAYDDAALYAAFRCLEPDVEALRTESKTRDDALWRDDCIEFMLRAPGQREFFQVIVNPAGLTYEAKDSETSWNPEIKAGVSKEEDAWCVEFALPWSDIGAKPAENDVWTANFCRERKVVSELSSWSPSKENFTNPDTFGEIRFASQPVRLEAFEVAPPLPGANVAKLRLALPDGTSAQLEVTGTAALMLNGGQAEPIDIVYPLGLTASDLVFDASVGGETVWRAAMPVSIEPRPRLAELEACIERFETLKGGREETAAFAEAVDAALAPAREAARALRAAIEESLAQSQPLAAPDYRKLNSTAGAQAAGLSVMHWPIWTKNNWLDLDRHEAPPDLQSISSMEVPALVNEYESRNFIITNLSTEALRLRVTASDLQRFPDTPADAAQLLTNGSLDADENGDGMPDGWKYGSGDRALWHLEEHAGRGRVGVVDCSTGTGLLTVRQDVALEPGQDYALEFWAKSERATPSLSVGVINSGWTWSRFSAPISGSHDWRRVRVPVRATANPAHQLVIWLRDGGSGQVWVDDIRLVEGDGGGVTFGGTAPDLLVADWQDLRGGSTVADPLIPLNQAGRLDVPPGESRQVWLTLPARDLPPGQYEFAITAQPLAESAIQGAPPGKRIIVQLDLLPVRLPTHADFAVYNWDYAKTDAYVRDLAEHKVNFFLVSSHMPIPKLDESGDPLGEMDFSALDKAIRMKLPYAREAGGELLFSYGIIRDFHHKASRTYKWDFMDEPWVKAFTWAYGQWIAHLKALGLAYDEFSVQIWDEAIGTDGDLAVQGGYLLRKLDPKLRLTMDGAQTVEEVKKMDPVIDVWIPHLHRLQNPATGAVLLAQYKSLGEPVYTYTCSTKMKALSPYTYHRLKPWYAAQMGLDGVFYWDYSSWRGDPWDDFDGPIADCGAVYDSPTGPITSRRWEASREGVEDWQIMRLVHGLDPDDALAGEALDAVLSNKDDPGLAHAYRVKLIEKAAELAAKSPLTLTGVEGGVEDGRLTIRFNTNRPACAKVLWRMTGDDAWRCTELPEATEHSASLDLLPFTEAEWFILAWDAQGRLVKAEG